METWIIFASCFIWIGMSCCVYFVFTLDSRCDILNGDTLFWKIFCLSFFFPTIAVFFILFWPFWMSFFLGKMYETNNIRERDEAQKDTLS